MKLDASLGACDVALRSSRRRRLVADTAYDATVLVSPTTVNASVLATALENLLLEGVTTTSTITDPTEELRLVPGIDTASVESFATAAAVAADASSVATEAETLVPPPPPSPPTPPPAPPPSHPSPPPRLVALDYESSATGSFAGVRGGAIFVAATVAIFTA